MSIPLLAILLLSSALLPLAAPLPIFDVAGEPLQMNTGYYMIAVSPKSSGGMTLAQADPSSPGSCPLKVSLSTSTSDKGIPVKITPESTGTRTLEVGGWFSLKFAFLYHCIPDTPWILRQASDKTRYIIPSLYGSSYDVFNIESAKSGYALKFCRRGICERVGAKKRGSEVILTLGGLTFNFVFEKYPYPTVGGDMRAATADS